MSVPITLAYLSTNQPDKGGVSIKATSVEKCVSFNYIMFPGNNISSTSVQNSFINRTLNVGSDGCELIESGDGFVYHLFISKTEVLCTSDYFLVVSGLQLDGTQTPYQVEPLPLPLTPDQITITDGDVFITRIGGDYLDATITIFFDPIDCPGVTDVISYIVAVQYLGGDGNWHFETKPATYESLLGGGGVQVTIVSEFGVDDAYVAIQGVRTVMSALGEYKAIGELSETILAQEQNVPQPPEDLLVVYVYNASPPTATLSWVAPTSAAFTDVTGFQVYRSVNGATAVALGDVVSYVPDQKDYEYVDEVPLNTPPDDLQAGDELTYYVVSIAGTRVSAPSNSVTIVLVAVSSAPLNFNALALQESETLASIKSLFQNPAEVEGDTENAYFVVNVYDSAYPLVVVATQNISYVGGSAAYEANFNNIAFSAFYNLECYLVTIDPNTLLPLEGAKAFISNLSCGYAPLIYKINGSTDFLLWRQSNEITSLEVISFTTLLSEGAKLLAIDSDISKRVHWEVISQISGVVTTTFTIPDTPYEPFAGAYRITYSNIPTTAFFAVGIYVANRNGDSNQAINGPFNSNA